MRSAKPPKNPARKQAVAIRRKLYTAIQRIDLMLHLRPPDLAEYIKPFADGVAMFPERGQSGDPKGEQP